MALMNISIIVYLPSLINRSGKLDIPINIHIGGSYNCDFEGTAARFIDVCRNRLTPEELSLMCVENDDKPNCWSVVKLYEHIYMEIKVPICFDIHHHALHPDNTPESVAFFLAQSTWGDRNMQVHYSQSPTDDKLVPKHSDYYRAKIPTYITDQSNIHIHMESKGKEKALLDYRKKLS